MIRLLSRQLRLHTAATTGPSKGGHETLSDTISRTAWLTRLHRVIAVGIVPLTVAPFAAGSLSPVLDSALISLIIIHSYIGFQYDLSSRHTIINMGTLD